MRISLEWLNEYVDLAGLKPEEIAEALTASGLEVEHVEYLGPKFSGVVVARVLAVEPHPNADKLRLVSVNLGAEQAKVVCGAPNVREGIMIAFAKEGAQVLNRKDGSMFTLGRATIRGVESAGMVCSIDELGLEAQFEKQEDGIWPIDALVNESQLGQDLKDALKLGGDVVLHAAPTANRGDLMSMLGVAREVAALFDRTVKTPEYRQPTQAGTPHPVQIALTEPDVCRYYGGLMMRHVKIGPAPDWMARRLQAAGMRSISNVVDITNYVMLEMGQPLHAFDQQKLGTRGTVDVRRARAGEQFTTLDDVARALTADSVAVTMNDTPVALAGVMGGQSTEIDDASTELFLESAYFPPASTRKSAKSVGLRSEASARFERGVDLENCRNALLRAAELLSAHAGAEVIGLVESPLPAVDHPRIPLRFARMEQVLGLAIEPETARRILVELGFGVQDGPEAGSITVTVPSYRVEDVTREIDLVEEVIRIYGYDKVPYTLPQKSNAVSISPRARMTARLHETMRGQGLQEVMTTSLIGESLLEKTGFSVNREQLVSVINSHSADHTLMRQSLIPNLLEVAKFNQAQGNKDVWLYELGRTFFKLGKANHKNSGVSERLHLGGLMSGSIVSGRWQGQETADFYLAKGVLESLFEKLNLSGNLAFSPANDVPWLHPGKTARLLLGEKGKDVGVLGELHPELQKNLKFRQPVYLFELNVEAVYKQIKQQAQAMQAIRISPYPAIERDMAFLAPQSLSHQEILNVIRGTDEPLLRDVTLFDEYRSEQLGPDKRSLAYRLTFRSDEATLTDQDADQRLGRIKEALSKQLPIQFR